MTSPTHFNGSRPLATTRWRWTGTTSRPSPTDRASRVRVFLETYGGLPPFDVAEAIATRMEITMAMELSLAQAGVEPQRTWVAQGSQERPPARHAGFASTPTS